MLDEIWSRRPDAAYQDREWMKDARCLGMPPWAADAIFFPERGFELPSMVFWYCTPCPVKEVCRVYGATMGLQEGFWGGATFPDSSGVEDVGGGCSGLSGGALAADPLPVP